MPPPTATPAPGTSARAPLVIGLDMGGTSTRALLATLDGTPLATATAGPGNPIAHGPVPAATALTTAVRAALATAAALPTEAAGAGAAVAGAEAAVAARVRLGLAGVAGGSVLGDPAVRALFDRAWRDAGPSCPFEVVGDPDVAFAGATAAPDGTVLIAGTGAAAARIHDHQLSRYTGGHGWLLGDEGAGFWLGREAIRTVLATLDGPTGVEYPARWPAGVEYPARWPAGVDGPARVDGPAGTGGPAGVGGVAGAAGPGAAVLVGLVLAELGLSGSRVVLPEAVIEAVNGAPPIRLARFAPLVSRAAEAGDPVARELVDRAADHLCRLVIRMHAAGAGPVVLAGSVVGAGTPVERAVRERLADAGIGPVLPAGDGAAGAAWLAIRAVRRATDRTDRGDRAARARQVGETGRGGGEELGVVHRRVTG
jgi:N-acetylglucosamine kinase-like BadF-type ATPase